MKTQTAAGGRAPHLPLLAPQTSRSREGYIDGPNDQGHYCFEDTRDADHEAWEIMFRHYQPYLMRLAASYRLGEDAHDAVQETFIHLVEHGGGIRKPQSLKYWLATVLRHECLRIIARRRREHPVDADNMDALLPPAEHTDVDHRLMHEVDAKAVQEALAHLPARQHQVMTLLADHETGGYRALAEHLDIPVGSIGPTRQRAIARLQEILTSMNYDRAA